MADSSPLIHTASDPPLIAADLSAPVSTAPVSTAPVSTAPSRDTVFARLAIPARDMSVLIVVMAIATWFVANYVPDEFWGNGRGDFVQFWSAGNLLASGQSPYDVEAQEKLNASVGWKEVSVGESSFRFMPYYYPPWFGFACIPFTTLPYRYAQALWVVSMFAAALISSVLLKRLTRPHGESMLFLLVPCFALTVQAARMGQIAPLLLLTVTAMCYLIQRDRPFAGGVCLAWMTIKPQVGAVLILATLVWAVRNRQWRVLYGFALACGIFVLVSTIVLPTWLVEMLSAPSQTPLLTVTMPWMGTSFWCVLQSLHIDGLLGIGIWVFINALAVGWVVRRAWTRDVDIAEIGSSAILTACLFAPYLRSYDFAVLMLPAVWLMPRLSAAQRSLFFFAIALVPWGHQVIRWQKDVYPILSCEVFWFWLVVALGLFWYLSTRREQLPLAESNLAS
jgi:hypothetical protein